MPRGAQYENLWGYSVYAKGIDPSEWPDNSDQKDAQAPNHARRLNARARTRHRAEHPPNDRRSTKYASLTTRRRTRCTRW